MINMNAIYITHRTNSVQYVNFCPTMFSLKAQSLSAFSFPRAQDHSSFVSDGLQFSKKAPLWPNTNISDEFF
jgi:hypothetical protein